MLETLLLGEGGRFHHDPLEADLLYNTDKRMMTLQLYEDAFACAPPLDVWEEEDDEDYYDSDIEITTNAGFYFDDKVPKVAAYVNTEAFISVFPVKIYVSLLRWKTIELGCVDMKVTIADLKKAILEKEGIRAADQRLVFWGRQLIKDSNTLEAEHIEHEATIWCVLRKRS